MRCPPSQTLTFSSHLYNLQCRLDHHQCCATVPSWGGQPRAGQLTCTSASDIRHNLHTAGRNFWCAAVLHLGPQLCPDPEFYGEQAWCWQKSGLIELQLSQRSGALLASQAHPILPPNRAQLVNLMPASASPDQHMHGIVSMSITFSRTLFLNGTGE